MSLSTTQARYQYAANGVATIFAFPEQFHSSTDLIVVTSILGVDSIKILNLDYTITGANAPFGGFVIFTAAPQSGTTITVFRAPQPTQPVDYVPQDNFPAETHEKALDRLTMLVQGVLLQLRRCIRTSISGPELESLDKQSRAGKAPQFDSSGNLILSDSTATSANLAIAAAAAAATSESAAAASAAAAMAAAAGNLISFVSETPTTIALALNDALSVSQTPTSVTFTIP
jgi:hypothetical protein